MRPKPLMPMRIAILKLLPGYGVLSCLKARPQWREGQFKSTHYPLMNSNYWAILWELTQIRDIR